jgi:hypothetical protein
MSANRVAYLERLDDPDGPPWAAVVRAASAAAGEAAPAKICAMRASSPTASGKNNDFLAR